MAKLLQAFDATKVDPTQGAGSLPVGRHPVIITESEVEGTKGGNGGMLTLTLKIIDGPQTGTTGPYRLNLYNQNPQACQIAERQMSAVCHAIGVYNVDDTQVMHNRPFMIEVGFQKGHEPGSNPDAKGYTEVKKVFDKDGNEPGKKQQQQSNNNGNQFQDQQADFQRKEEQRMAGGPGGGSAQNWGNNGGNNSNQNQSQNNGGNGNWGNNGGSNNASNNSGNGGGNSNGGGGWGNNAGGNNQGGNGGNGGGSWQQNAGGAQGGGNSNGGWGQRN